MTCCGRGFDSHLLHQMKKTDDKKFRTDQLLKGVEGQCLAYAFKRLRASGFRLRINDNDGRPSSVLDSQESDVLVSVVNGDVTRAWFTLHAHRSDVESNHVSNARTSSRTDQRDQRKDRRGSEPRRGPKPPEAPSPGAQQTARKRHKRSHRKQAASEGVMNSGTSISRPVSASHRVSQGTRSSRAPRGR